MSMSSRGEYLRSMRSRYRAAKSKKEKTAFIDELVRLLSYHRKYAIQVLRVPNPAEKARSRRHRRSIGVGTSICILGEAGGRLILG